MRRMGILLLAAACLGSGCRLPVPNGVNEAEVHEAEDKINAAISLLVAGAIVGLIPLFAGPDRGKPDPEPGPEERRIKADLDIDRAHVRRTLRPKRQPKAEPRRKPLPAWY